MTATKPKKMGVWETRVLNAMIRNGGRHSFSTHRECVAVHKLADRGLVNVEKVIQHRVEEMTNRLYKTGRHVVEVEVIATVTEAGRTI